MPKKSASAKAEIASASSIRPIKKLMVANRSEIAIRVMRAATELGLKTVGIYAAEDRFCPHRFKADEAYELNKDKGPLGAYLDIEGIVTIAKEKGVDAIHPGYGFLSENPQFAKACADAGIIFIGPEAKILDMMGDKTAARNIARKLKVSILEGTDEPVSDRKEAIAAAKKIGFPLIIKAAFGGGGRGMRVVREAKDLEKLLDEAQTEALRSFGNGAVFLEKFVGKAKHIEVQIIADKHGNVLHLHERDCSVQRRHQKVIEQAPSYGVKQERHRRTLRCSGEAGEGGELHPRGHRRVPRRSRDGGVVLHRDESAHPGGAHGHGGDHRHRHRAQPDFHRAGLSDSSKSRSRCRCRRRSRRAASPSSAASPRKTRRTASRPTLAKF
jgi:pyruvate carboxylase